MVIGVILAGLAMSLGWGIRGDYGHEAGAMIPGALLGLSICLASGREDWWRRASLMGMCGAVGWAFGGQMGYARITGYTASSSPPDVFYGYASLFLIGGCGPASGPRSSPVEEGGTRRLRLLALALLLIVMMWANLFKNVRNWTNQKQIPADVLGLGSSWWLLLIGILLSATVVVALLRHDRRCLALSPTADFGRGQLLYLLVTWIPALGAFTQAMPGRGVFLVHASFWISAGLASLIAVSLSPEAEIGRAQPCVACEDSWRMGRAFWVVHFSTRFVPYCATRLTVAAHGAPLPGNALRFAETISPN